MPWIWQHPDWSSRLRWRLEELTGPLGQARRLQGRLLARTEALERHEVRRLQASALTEEALQTSAVEGELLDAASVRSSVGRRLGVDAAGLPASDRRVEGLVEMLLDASTGWERPMSAERLRGWQAGLFPTGRSGLRRIAVGAWRSGSEPMQVVSGLPGEQRLHFEAPPSERVPAEMERWLDWWSSGAPSEGLLRAALAQLWLVTIHPFDDGNGRVSRAVSDLALAQDEGRALRVYSLSAQIRRERSDYYAQLEAAQRGEGDVTAWMAWFLGCVVRAMQAADGELDHALARAGFWRLHGRVALGERQLKVLERVLREGPDGFEGGLTTRKYASMAKTSRATAQRELADLVERGLLLRSGAGRSVRYQPAWPEAS